MKIGEIRKENVFAAPSEYVKRAEAEGKSMFRSDFQRDRDRILYSKSFRRLSGKTQVFLTRTNDHVRNRLTHSLEVNQIACTTAKMLGLNSELTEAIALGHDIGHTPFGHVGERTLNLIMNNCVNLVYPGLELLQPERGFKHNLQGVRIFSDLHRIYPTLKGTNLTNFTLYGIAHHSSVKCKKCDHYSLAEGKCYRRHRVTCKREGELLLGFYDQYYALMNIAAEAIPAWSFEAYVVAFADEIAQRHHDVEDAFLMNILAQKDIVNKIKECFGHLIDQVSSRKLDSIASEKDFFLPLISQFIVHTYNTELIKAARVNLVKFADDVQIAKRTDFIHDFPAYSADYVKKIIAYRPEFAAADKCFQGFLRNTILNSHRAQRMDGKGSYLLERIFKAYFTNPRQLHDSTILSVFNMLDGTKLTLNTVEKPKLGEFRKDIASASQRSDIGFEKILARAICDHIAGMTDNFLMEEYKRLYGDGAV
jgi:dGTPase